MSDNIKLKYLGDGRYIPGVPARDLILAEVEEIANRWEMELEDAIEVITRRKLYSEVKTRKATVKPSKPSKETATIEGEQQHGKRTDST